MNSENLTYNPSMIAKLARLLIPLLRTLLPKAIFKNVYNALYFSYKWVIKNSFYYFVLKSKLIGSKEEKLRCQLTWRLLPYTMGGRKALENAFDIISKIERKGVPGILVECGVAEGGTAAMLALANKKLGTNNRQKWFFDSYEGLPEPTDEDYIQGKAGGFIRPLPKGSCLGTIEQVNELMFETIGMDKNEVHLIKGWFQDTVPAYKDKLDDVIAVLRLDGDWYESTKIPLDNFYDKVSIGGIVIIDDYGTCFGAKKATDEFRVEHDIQGPLIPDGRGGVWFEKES